MADIKHVTEDYPSDEKAVPAYGVSASEDGLVVENVDDLKRRLTGRQIQMITIGGSIGTALFVSIGSGLVQGGPGSLLIAFTMYCFFLAAVNSVRQISSSFSVPFSGVHFGSLVRRLL